MTIGIYTSPSLRTPRVLDFPSTPPGCTRCNEPCTLFPLFSLFPRHDFIYHLLRSFNSYASFQVLAVRARPGFNSRPEKKSENNVGPRHRWRRRVFGSIVVSIRACQTQGFFFVCGGGGDIVVFVLRKSNLFCGLILVLSYGMLC